MNNKKVAIIGCLHGNEQVGYVVIKELGKVLKKYGVSGVIANKLALEKGVRFIDQDLNRSFPGKPNGNYEERLAYGLSQIVGKYDSVVDLHSFSCQSPPFAIITNNTPEHRNLAGILGVNKVVLMLPELALGKSLIDYCRVGISIEAGRHNLIATNNRAIRYVTRILTANKVMKTKPIYYQIIGIVYRKDSTEKLIKQVVNFKLIHKGEIISQNRFGKVVAGYDFYPVLAREAAYPDILCLAAKAVIIKVDEEENE